MKKILLSFTLTICSLLVVNNVNAQCEAAAGLPIPPEPITGLDLCTLDMDALKIQGYTEEPGGATNQVIAVTYQRPDTTYATSWDAPIQGLTEDGTFDFCDKPLGRYCFHAFSYNQADLDIITENATIQAAAPCLAEEGLENLQEVLDCIGTLFPVTTIDGAIDSVLSQLVPIFVPEFMAPNDPPCYDLVPQGMEYCLDLTCVDGTGLCNIVLDVDEYFNDTFGVNNSPNPFSAKTFINYTTKINGMVDFKVYSSAGALVYEQELKSIAGSNRFEFESGSLEDGVYFYTIGDANAATPNNLRKHRSFRIK